MTDILLHERGQTFQIPVEPTAKTDDGFLFKAREFPAAAPGRTFSLYDRTLTVEQTAVSGELRIFRARYL